MNKLAANAVNYVRVTGQALNVALTEVKRAHDEKQAAATLVPEIVQSLVASGLIDDTDQLRKMANAQLSNHSEALEILGNVITTMHNRLKEANTKLASLDNGRAVPDDNGGKVASNFEDADMALLSVVPQLAGKYR